MLHLTSGWCLAVELGFGVFCLLDVVVSPEAVVRWIPRWGWALFLLAFPVAAAILWLAAGRPWRLRVRRAVAVPLPQPPDDASLLTVGPLRAPTVPVPPDERTPELTLAEELLAVHEEHERTLLAWESDLRRREAALQAAGGAPGTD
jgi:hypothetical protein